MTRRIALLAVAGLSLARATANAQSTDTLPARVDGRRIHMVASGGGVPTVVLEAGFSSTSRTWSRVQSELARTHRVIAYDRAGLGQSEPSAVPRTSRAIVEDLREALRSVGVDPPYILVGHSAGGLHARMFAGLYPAEVAGLVLVDPAPEDFYARAKREQPSLYAYFDSIDAASYSAGSPGEVAEDAQWERTLQEVRETEGRYGGPVILLSSSRTDLRELGPLWTDEHRRWAARARRREYVPVEGAGHDIHRERPAAVLDAVRRVLRIP
jgi:pimeloyl-ACP methyl ester carboxylesterase